MKVLTKNRSRGRSKIYIEDLLMFQNVWNLNAGLFSLHIWKVYFINILDVYNTYFQQLFLIPLFPHKSY